MPLTAEARAKGGRNRAAKVRLAKAVRVMSADQLPNGGRLETMDDAVVQSADLYLAIRTGKHDPATARESNRAIVTFVNATDKANLQRRIRELERKLKQYEEERTA